MISKSRCGILVGIIAVVGYALVRNGGNQVQNGQSADTSDHTTSQYLKQSDVDFNGRTDEVTNLATIDELAAHFHADEFANEQSVSLETPTRYMMSQPIGDEANYNVELVFEYDCNTTDPPVTSLNLEPALLEYHEYVNEESNQGLASFGIVVKDTRTSECTQTTNGNGRKLLRELRKTYVDYDLIAKCIGYCPEQILPKIDTGNRGRLLPAVIELLNDTVPYLEQFKLIFFQQLDLNVTQATTNLDGTTRKDCTQSENCYNGSSCCGINDCKCTVISKSLCITNACDLPGCCDDYKEDCVSFPTCTCLSNECSDRDLCCADNIFRNCNNFCPLPTSFPSQSPTTFTPTPVTSPIQSPPTLAPTSVPSSIPIPIPSPTLAPSPNTKSKKSKKSSKSQKSGKTSKSDKTYNSEKGSRYYKKKSQKGAKDRKSYQYTGTSS